MKCTFKKLKMYGDENQINRVDMFATGGYRPDNNLSRRCKNVTQ